MLIYLYEPYYYELYFVIYYVKVHLLLANLHYKEMRRESKYTVLHRISNYTIRLLHYQSHIDDLRILHCWFDVFVQ